jgi:hypothetical protein
LQECNETPQGNKKPKYAMGVLELAERNAAIKKIKSGERNQIVINEA